MEGHNKNGKADNTAAGLLKLDRNKLNELKSKTQQTMPRSNESKNESKASGKVDAKASDSLNDKPKMLFNPSDPKKPIMVEQKPKFIHFKSPKSFNDSASSSTTSDPHLTSNLNQLSVGKPSSHQQQNADKITKANKLIDSTQLYEKNLKRMIDSFEQGEKVTLSEFITNIKPIRKQLEHLCIEVIVTHLEISNSQNVDLNHWKSCYHHLIETLRKYGQNLKKSSSNESEKLVCEVNTCLNEFIDEGFKFYTKLIELLEDKFLKFKISSFLTMHDYEYLTSDKNLAQQQDISIKTKDMKLAMMCIHRSFISMGDLARYRETILFSSQASSTQRDFSLARSYYLNALTLAPKNSRSYHQLAIIAIYTKRRLDACYYYFRCLEVPMPLSSVRQALNSIFEEIRIKSDAIIKMMMKTLNTNKKQCQAINKTNKALKSTNRVEFWHRPESLELTNVTNKKKSVSSDESYSDSATTSTDDDDDVDEDEAQEEEEEKNSLIDEDEEKKLNIQFFGLSEKKLSLNELNRRFMLNYLNAIGKLFTKVGMENYMELHQITLNQFKELLKREPNPLGKMRLLQIVTINISVIDLNFKSNNDHLLQSTLKLSFDIFVLITERFNQIVKKILKVNQDISSIDQTFHNLISSITTFSRWMQHNKQIWESTLKMSNKWPTLSNMFNLLNKLLPKYDEFISNDSSNLRLIINNIQLEEDIELLGFSPVLNIPREQSLDSSKVLLASLANLTESQINIIKNCKRIKQILSFANYLREVEEPILIYDNLKQIFMSNKSSTISTNNSEANLQNEEEMIQATSLLNEKTSKLTLDQDSLNNMNIKSTNHLNDSNLNDLKEKRDILKVKMEEQFKRESHHKQLLEMSAQRQLEIEIRPKYLLADTNCYIDFLNLIDRILKTSYYILIVPLLVINELEKLSKSISNYNDDSYEHAIFVQQSAKKAIKYLNEKFEKKEKNLKAITSEGSIITTIQFKSEEVKKKGTNDELILGCCIHYCKDNGNNEEVKTNGMRLFREIVLLTDDRHLRLKAHTRNVPAKNIKQFMKWSNI